MLSGSATESPSTEHTAGTATPGENSSPKILLPQFHHQLLSPITITWPNINAENMNGPRCSCIYPISSPERSHFAPPIIPQTLSASPEPCKGLPAKSPTASEHHTRGALQEPSVLCAHAPKGVNTKWQKDSAKGKRETGSQSWLRMTL